MAYNDLVVNLEMVIELYTLKTKELAQTQAEDERRQLHTGSSEIPKSQVSKNLSKECRALKQNLKDVLPILTEIFQSFDQYDELAQMGLSALELRLTKAERNRKDLRSSGAGSDVQEQAAASVKEAERVLVDYLVDMAEEKEKQDPEKAKIRAFVETCSKLTT